MREVDLKGETTVYRCFCSRVSCAYGVNFSFLFIYIFQLSVPPRCLFRERKNIETTFSLVLFFTKDFARAKNINDKFLLVVPSRFCVQAVSLPRYLKLYPRTHAGRLISFIIFRRRFAIRVVIERAISYINTAINSCDDHNT